MSTVKRDYQIFPIRFKRKNLKERLSAKRKSFLATLLKELEEDQKISC